VTSPRPLVIAHRGASGYRPEHTRSAFELAIALGADAVEPDIVASRDGVLVLRHDVELSGTTDVASRREFADRRTKKVVDGKPLSGWFVEDFDWAELATLRATERIPQVRRASATFDGHEGILRLSDLLALIDAAGRPVLLVAEIKHATHYASLGLRLDELFAEEVRGWATAGNLVVESFEQGVLMRIRSLGVPGRLVFLTEGSGAPVDLVAQHGAAARSYADHLSDEGLARLATEVDGVSVARKQILVLDRAKKVVGVTDIVARAHAAGLEVYCYTLRAENKFLAKNNRSGGEAGDLGNWRREFELVMGTGLDGVFADQPDLALAARASMQSPA